MDAALDHYSYGANLKGVKREELLRRLATVKVGTEVTRLYLLIHTFRRLWNGVQVSTQ